MNQGNRLGDCVEDWMSKNPICVYPNDEVQKVCNLMTQNSIGSILVKSHDKNFFWDRKEGSVIGIITDSDIVRRVTAHDVSPNKIRVLQVMSSPVITIPKNETTYEVIKRMMDHTIKRLPVIENEKLIGIFTITDLMYALVKLGKLYELEDLITKMAKKEVPKLQDAKEMMIVENWMTKSIVFVKPENSVLEAAQIMNHNKFGSLPVINDRGLIEGIITDTDIVRMNAKSEFIPSSIFVEQVMTRKLVMVTKEESIINAVELMNKHKIKRLPVVADQKVLGLLSTTDILNVLLQMNLYTAQAHKLIAMLYKGNADYFT